MKIVNDILSDLREKRLLGVGALLLLVALVVVPMRLSKPGEVPAAAVVPPANTQQDGGPVLTLTRASKTGFERAPRVNTHAMDPFGERTDKQSKAALKALRAQIKAALSSVLGGSSGSGTTTDSTSSGDGGGVVPNPPSEDPAPDTTPASSGTEEDDLLSLLVTVGDGQPTPMNDIRTLSPLPDATDPFLVYTGKSSNGGAVFIVSADAQPTGDGSCDPSPQDCRTLTLNEGETEDFKLLTAGGSTVQITVVGVETGKVTTTGTAARAARLEAKARKVGAGVVKDALDDPSILQSLADRKVRFRH